MMQFFRTLCLPVIACLLATPSLGQESPSDGLGRLEQFRQLVQDLEQVNGRYTPSLLEPLSGVAAAAMELHQFGEADAALERAVQIARISDGLYTESQLPLLERMVENDARRGNWEDANATLEHLYWLYINEYRGIDDRVIQHLVRLGNYHLEAVALDTPERQAYHFRNAEQISAVALRAARLLWGSGDVRLAPLQYSLVKQYFLQAVAIDKRNRTGYALRELYPGSSWILPRQQSRREYYARGTRLLEDMRQLFLNASPEDLTAAAMAELYLADWQLLFTQEVAEATYRQAYDHLLAAQVDQAELEAFFSRPLVLPEMDFYASVQLALTARRAADVFYGASEAEGTDYSIQFDEWSAAFPDVALPLRGSRIRPGVRQDWPTVLVKFSLGRLEKVSRWVNGRFYTGMSVPKSVEVLTRHPESDFEIKVFTERLQSLHFRPRLNQGVAEPVNGTLQYWFSGN